MILHLLAPPAFGWPFRLRITAGLGITSSCTTGMRAGRDFLFIQRIDNRCNAADCAGRERPLRPRISWIACGCTAGVWIASSCTAGAWVSRERQVARAHTPKTEVIGLGRFFYLFQTLAGNRHEHTQPIWYCFQLYLAH